MSEVSQARLEGRNPVLEALRAGRELDKILIAKGVREGSVGKIRALARENGIVVQEVDRKKLDQLSETGAHQGVMAYAAAAGYVTVDEMIARARQRAEQPFLVIADEVEDPHNLGALLRTANAAGAHGLIIPKRRSAGLGAVTAKASAGAVEFTPVAKVANLVQTIEALKKENIWVIGADMDGAKTLYEQDFRGAAAIVVGSEGRGISRLIKEACDFLVRIPMAGEITSLNASVAGALLMYEVVRSRQNR